MTLLRFRNSYLVQIVVGCFIRYYQRCISSRGCHISNEIWMRYSDLCRKYLVSKRNNSRNWELIHVPAVDHNDKFQLVVPAVLSASFRLQLATSSKFAFDIAYLDVQKRNFQFTGNYEYENGGYFFWLRKEEEVSSHFASVSLIRRGVPHSVISSCIYVLMYAWRLMFLYIDPCLCIYALYVCLYGLCMHNRVYSLLYMLTI
jgi:hypothetical protein